MATKDIFKRIVELADELGSAQAHRQELVQEVTSLKEELAALDQMAEDATDREEYDGIMAQRKAAELDIRFARNRLRRFDQSPRVDPETLADLLSMLAHEADAAAEAYRKKVKKPLEAVVDAGDEFDQTIHRIREAVGTLASVTGPATERDNGIRQMFCPFELGTLRSRAYTDNRRIVHPDFRDALKLAASAKLEPFDTH